MHREAELEQSPTDTLVDGVKETTDSPVQPRNLAQEAAPWSPEQREKAPEGGLTKPTAGGEINAHFTADETAVPATPTALTEEGSVLNELGEEGNTTLLADDINFPKLQTPVRPLLSPNACISPSQQQTTPSAEKTAGPRFVWGPKAFQSGQPPTPRAQKEKSAVKTTASTSKLPDSTPITMQGY